MKKSFWEDLHDLFVFLHKFTYEIYIAAAAVISSFMTAYYKIDMAFFCFVLLTSLDTITRVHADAVKKKLVFNPFKAYFWREFKSDKFRAMLNKIFSEYGIYLIIAFILDTLVFDKLLLNIYGQKLTLPVIALYIFSFIELWSIGENIDDAGGVNIFKRIVHLLPEKVQEIINPKEKEK
jgi:hypothetical protein